MNNKTFLDRLKSFDVNKSNAHSCWLSLKALAAGRGDLGAMLCRCPVQVEISGLGFIVFSRIDEVDMFTAEIEAKLGLYRIQRPKHRKPFVARFFRLERFAISSRNIDPVRRYIVALQKERDYILRNMRRYPLEVVAHGICFLFSDRREVDWLIGELKRRVRAAEKLEAEGWWKPLLALGG